MQEHTLTVTAERRDDRDEAGKRWHRVEHRYGQYTRTISLPQDAANSGIEAVYKQGVLSITVPKAPESRPTKIQVRGA
jgi:HSP20 family protein